MTAPATSATAKEGINPFLAIFALLVHGPLFWWMGTGIFPMVLFGFGLSWGLAFLTPSALEKVQSKKYRFSFLRTCFLLQRGVDLLLKAEKHPLRATAARLITPTLLYLCFSWVMGGPQYVLFPFWGSMVGEGVLGMANIVRSWYVGGIRG